MEDSPSQRPWPENFKPTVICGNKYFRIEESLLVLGVKIHVKKKGYKDLDNLLERHGKTSLFLFKSVSSDLNNRDSQSNKRCRKFIMSKLIQFLS